MRRGAALSKQRLAHWVTQVILHAYESAGKSAPSSIHCHSTRALATSWAAFKGVSLSEICAAATWTSSCTFSHFYRLNVTLLPAVCAAVLSACPDASQGDPRDCIGIRLPLVLSALPLAVWSERK